MLKALKDRSLSMWKYHHKVMAYLTCQITCITTMHSLWFVLVILFNSLLLQLILWIVPINNCIHWHRSMHNCMIKPKFIDIECDFVYNSFKNHPRRHYANSLLLSFTSPVTCLAKQFPSSLQTPFHYKSRTL